MDEPEGDKWSGWRQIEHSDGTLGEYRETVFESEGAVFRLVEGRTELRGNPEDYAPDRNTRPKETEPK
jgi:hypothetical protein